MPQDVLIVDDHAPFRRVVGELLRDSGHRIVGEAATGTQGLEAAARLRPQAVLLDVGLPDMTGFAVAAGARPPAARGSAGGPVAARARSSR